MLPAEYFGSGSVSKDTFGYYGLASEIYTHFTSPVRPAEKSLYIMISETTLMD